MTWTWPGGDDFTDRAGKCYTLAFEALLENLLEHGNRMTLVHGLIHPERAEVVGVWREANPGLPLPPPNPHAWVELTAVDGVLVADPVVRQVWERDDHRREYGTEVLRAYRADVAVEVAARRDDYGPWDKRSLAAHAERQRVARADPRFTMDAALERFGLRRAVESRDDQGRLEQGV